MTSTTATTTSRDCPRTSASSSPKAASGTTSSKLHENIGAGLQLIFDRLQEANPDTLAGVFGSAQWANKQVLPEERLLAVLDVFSSLQLDPDSVTHDLLGNAYEYLLKNFADESGKKAGEFFTPRAVVRLMVQLLDPQAGESIYDPTCGSGGMLVESVNQVRAHGQDPRTLRLYGQEVQATTAAIARMNLYLHDIETFSIRRGDTLRDPRFREPDGSLTSFDVVIANPPFSLKNWGRTGWADDPYGRAELGVPPESYADFAFVEHMLVSMKHTSGRLAVVMPHGVLFRRGAEAQIRQRLVEAGLLEAVIGLPPNLFYNTTIPAAILLCRGGRATSEVLFVDASARFRSEKNQNEMRPEDVVAVVHAVRGADHSEHDLVHKRAVAPDEIAEAGFDLSISRYVAVEAAEEVELAVAVEAYRESRDALYRAHEELDEQLAELGL